MMKKYEIIKVNIIEQGGFTENIHLEGVETYYFELNEANKECAKLNYYAQGYTYYYYINESPILSDDEAGH
jgi:hypothetical protein